MFYKVIRLKTWNFFILRKVIKTSFKRSIHKSKDKLEYTHSDLWGPAQQVSLGSNNYFLSIIDDFLRRVWVYILKSKDYAGLCL